jgi:hypothetical protein
VLLKNGFNTLSILTNNDEIKKAVPILAMEAPRGRRGLASTHSYLDTRWGECSASRPSRALPPRIDPPPVPSGQEAGWASDLVWTQRPEECNNNERTKTELGVGKFISRKFI